jgi:hypothetical protein
MRQSDTYKGETNPDPYIEKQTLCPTKKQLPIRQSVPHRTQVSINQLTVILRDTAPPIIEVAKLGYAAVAVYSLLYQSAYQDQRYDVRKCVRRKDLRHCGGTTSWSHKAIADTLGMGKAKVIFLLIYCLTTVLFSMKVSCRHQRVVSIEFIELFIPR